VGVSCAKQVIASAARYRIFMVHHYIRSAMMFLEEKSISQKAEG